LGLCGWINGWMNEWMDGWMNNTGFSDRTICSSTKCASRAFKSCTFATMWWSEKKDGGQRLRPPHSHTARQQWSPLWYASKVSQSVLLSHNRVVRKVTLSSPFLLGLLFTPYPLFQWYLQAKDILINLGMKCCNSVWNADTQHLMHKARD
jgi:hypothetical protein